MGLFCIIPQSHCAIVERLGKFSRVQGAGLHFRLPFIETRKRLNSNEWLYNGAPCAHKPGPNCSFFDLSDQRLNTNVRTYHTADNVEVTIDAVIFWRIVSPERAVYDVDDLITSMIDIALNALRAQVGALSLDELLAGRSQLTQTITADLAATTNKWGIALQKVEIQELTVNDKTQQAMLKQMEAEREKRASVSIAEGESKAKLILAEADRQAAILRAEGVAKSQQIIADADAEYLTKICGSGLSHEEASKILLAQKYMEGFEVISQNKADKVYLPNSASSLIVDGK